MTDRRSVNAVVHGRVQGVFFRDSTQQAARRAGVSGWVGNAPDGTVRAHLEGPAQAVEQVLDFLRRGPEQARVDRVEVSDSDQRDAVGFEVR